MIFGRITFNKSHNDMRSAIQKKEFDMNNVQNQLATQNRLQRLSDDPIRASHGTRYASVLVRKEVYSTQNRRIFDSINVMEGYVRQSVDYIQSSRELAVRAANGTFTKNDRSIMANEIDQHLEGLYALANAQDADGRYLFGGTRTNVPPFRGLRTASNRMHKDVINDVEYVGSNNPGKVEISAVDKIDRNIPGSTMFWTRHPRLEGSVQALNFTTQNDSVITINNVDINITQGDTIYSLIEKINSSLTTVSASVDPASGALVIQGNDTQQLWLSDKSGQVLQDVGLIDDSLPPHNISNDAFLADETIFDSLIRLRDSMFDGNYKNIGGKSLAALDGSLRSIVTSLSKIGAVTERLDIVYKRIEMQDIPNITRQYDNQVAIDISEAVTRMAEYSLAKAAAYAVGTKIMGTTLLDYLR